VSLCDDLLICSVNVGIVACDSIVRDCVKMPVFLVLVMFYLGIWYPSRFVVVVGGLVWGLFEMFGV